MQGDVEEVGDGGTQRDAKLVERTLADVLQVTEPRLPFHHYGTSNVSAASMKA